MKDSETPQEAKQISRREFLKLAVGTLAGAALASCIPKPGEPGSNLPSADGAALRNTELLPTSEVRINLGEEESINLAGISWVPDGRTSFIKQPDGSTRFYLAAGTEGYSFNQDEEGFDTPAKFISPDKGYTNLGYNGYRAPGTVFVNPQNSELVCVYHQEFWQSANSGFPFTAQVGISHSTDNGQSWENIGPVLLGQNQISATKGERVSGAGQPAGIIVEDNGTSFLYTYYVDWDSGEDAIHLARAPLSQLNDKNAWQKHNSGSFSSAFDGASTPVISPPPGESYAALPSISWNNQINKYLALYETNTGFWISTSRNAVDWVNPQKIASFPQPHSERDLGNTWFSYPSLLSEDQDNQFNTSSTGHLYYSRGQWNQGSHNMCRKSFDISQNA